MVTFTKREQIVILIFVIAVASLAGYSILNKDKVNISKADEEIEELDIEDPVDFPTETDEENSNSGDNIDETIMIHISGQVRNPGLVVLKIGDRVIDAVEEAGGLKEEADIDRINLARKVIDEEKVYIPKIGELTVESSSIENNDVEAENSNSDIRININSAGKTELMGLTGIGEVLAGRIIEHRIKNKFNRIEDIINVSGIGEKKFEEIKDEIRVK